MVVKVRVYRLKPSWHIRYQRSGVIGSLLGLFPQ